MTIGEVAERSGVATSALRFYEDQGLIHPERNDSGHRRYPRAVIRVVAFIVFAQKIGLSLEEVRAELAKLPRNRVPERRTGRSSPAGGRSGFESGSPSSNAWRRASANVSDVGACRSIDASSPTLAIERRDAARDLATGLRARAVPADDVKRAYRVAAGARD